jgi:hypothetical protein
MTGFRGPEKTVYGVRPVRYKNEEHTALGGRPETCGWHTHTLEKKYSFTRLEIAEDDNGEY